MSTPKNFTAEDRQAIAELQESLGSSWESFNSLRSDSYEHAIARVSLEQLELFYAEVLKPGQNTADGRLNCPHWPEGAKNAGKLPSKTVLDNAATRLRTDGVLNGMGRVSDLLDTLRRKAAALPAGKQSEVVDTVISLAGEELIAAKLAGGTVIGNLEVVDRLLTNASAKTKAAHDAKIVELKEKAEERQGKKLNFEINKNRDHIAELLTDEVFRRKAEALANSNLPRAEMIKQMRQLAFADVDELEQSGKVVIPKA